MLDTFNGAPVHVLVVHAVVVLLPLAVIGTIVLAVAPRWRLTYGPLLILLSAVGVALIPVATSSGEELEKRVGDPGEHAELGEQLLWFALPLLILLAAMIYLQRRNAKAAGTGSASVSTTVVTIVAALAVVAALATAVQVYRVGDSGAKAAWSDQISSGSSSGSDSD